MKKRRGFTLIELMVVVAIVAILATVAITSYSKQVRKGRRAEAKQVVADWSLREEKWRSNNATYQNTPATLLGAAVPTYDWYTFAIATPTGNCDTGVAAAVGNSYQITATAKSDQTKDTGCTALVLSSKCGVVAKTPTACW